MFPTELVGDDDDDEVLGEHGGVGQPKEYGHEAQQTRGDTADNH